ncbi:MAG: hemerythrin domain-containing protein [Burkholderiales bacterium]|nr:hemerythrin domain-containing protein [Burkholderiales bacterium]
MEAPERAAGAASAAAGRALGLIRDEHRTLAAVLSGLRFLVHDIQAGRAAPDFELFRAMTYYIDAYPERLHHPQEENHLFRRLEARTAAADAVLDELRREHAAGEAAIRDLEHSLLAYEQSGSLQPFAEAVETFVADYFSHMRKEEDVVLPLAVQWLDAADWTDIAAAFAANRDPLAGQAEADFRKLFSRIVNLAPPPLGVGPPFPRQSQRAS